MKNEWIVQQFAFDAVRWREDRYAQHNNNERIMGTRAI